LSFHKLLLFTLLLSLFAVLFGSQTSAQTDPPLSLSATPGEWLRLRKLPDLQYVKRGDAAEFYISVSNTSGNFAMETVVVNDETAPSCARNIGDLAPSGDLSYPCRYENVQEPFTNEAVVTGNNATNGKQDTASDTARVEVLDLFAVVAADPNLLAAPGGTVTFSVEVTNNGSVDIQLTGLDSPQFGDLSDPANAIVGDNSCATAGSLPKLASDGGSFSCAFSFEVNEAPGEHTYDVTATAEVGAGVTVEDSGTAVVTLFDVIGLTLMPETNKAVTGGSVLLTASVSNLDENLTVSIVTLEDSELGDVTPFGDCVLPQTLPPGESYTCAYEQTLDAAPGDEQTYTLTVGAQSISVPPVTLSDQASTTVLAASPNVYLPALSLIPRPTSCATRLRIKTDETYLFYPDTANAVYWFVLTEDAQTIVSLTNFVPEDGQVSVYQDGGSGCDPATLSLIGYDGSNNRDRTMRLGTLQAGNYYILVYSGEDLTDEEAYSLFVQTQS
jgi:hypothetical protein